MNGLKSFFSFNKRQERGIFVLCILLLIVILINRYALDIFTNKTDSCQENTEYLQQIKLRSIEKKSLLKTKSTKVKDYNTQMKILPKEFNPNKASIEELKKLGLSERVANNFEKYRSCGGVFYKKEDIKKIYGLSDDVYSALKNYIIIPKERKKTKNELLKDNSKKNYTKDVELKKRVVDTIFLGINSVDSVQLLQIKGIGPFYAGAIIKYRNQLGGYKDIHQLFDLYKMDTIKFEMMSQCLYLDTVSLVKININEADFKTILKHPYINYETTKYIVNKRRKLGQYAALYQLKDPKEMPDDIYNKLLPYLALD